MFFLIKEHYISDNNTMASNIINLESIEDYKTTTVDQHTTEKSCDGGKKYDFKLMKSQTGTT